MSDAYIGEIRMFGGNFAPLNWALCDGQILAITQNDALFSLIGATYGGDARTNFKLPDLRGRIPVHQGQGNGLSQYVIGHQAGQETTTLTAAQMPSHHHNLVASSANAVTETPQQGVYANTGAVLAYDNAKASQNFQKLADSAVGNRGGSEPHNNMMPSLCISFIICLAGLYPPRN